MSISAPGVAAYVHPLACVPRVSVRVWKCCFFCFPCVIFFFLKKKSFLPEGLNSLFSRSLSRTTSGLSYQSIDVAPVLLVALRDLCDRRPRPPLRRNTNGDADSFWFGHLSRHWSPCGLPLWWQMDCHLWMRRDWDTSPHISLSGVQWLTLFPSLCLCLLICPTFLSPSRCSIHLLYSLLSLAT